MNFSGLNIVPHSLAVTTKCVVARHPTLKRRRNWRVVRVTVPCYFQSGNTLFMHPSLIEKLRGIR